MQEEEIVNLLAGPWLRNTVENYLLVSLQADSMESLCDYCTHLFFRACDTGVNSHRGQNDLLQAAQVICNNFLILGLRGVLQREPLVCVHANICRPVLITYGEWQYVLYFQNAPFPNAGCHAEA